jgi:quercetin dioxygenase-like cupin family protein
VTQEMARPQDDELAAEKIQVYVEHYAKERIFVRELSSSRYGLTERRRERLRTVPRVFTPSSPGAGTSENWKIVDPGDDPFRTQSLHVHFVTIQAGGRNDGHGHQNEALFYVLQGNGYEMHDGKRYDWNAGDAVAVHNDCVHWHNNADPDHPAVCLVMKPKPTYLFLGLWNQGKIGTKPPEDDDQWGPRSEWLTARPEGDELIPKVLKPTDTAWEWTPFGRVRKLAGEGVPLRIKGADAYLHEIPAGSRSGRRWQMADEVAYVLEGSGYDLHWDVDVEIDDQFYARIAKEPSRHEWKKGDVIWVPQNTVVQRFNTSPDAPAKLVGASNRMFAHLGYSRVVYFESAPESAA